MLVPMPAKSCLVDDITREAEIRVNKNHPLRLWYDFVHRATESCRLLYQSRRKAGQILKFNSTVKRDIC